MKEGKTEMEAEFYGDERDYEPGGIYYDGPMYLSEDEDDDDDDDDDDSQYYD